MMYLTRDKDENGKLSGFIDVWTEFPSRVSEPTGVVEWISQDKDNCLTGHSLVLTRMQCMNRFGTVPMNDEEVCRVSSWIN